MRLKRAAGGLRAAGLIFLLATLLLAGCARERLLQSEREQFLRQEWPRLREKLRRLGLSAKDLDWEELQ